MRTSASILLSLWLRSHKTPKTLLVSTNSYAQWPNCPMSTPCVLPRPLSHHPLSASLLPRIHLFLLSLFLSQTALPVHESNCLWGGPSDENGTLDIKELPTKAESWLAVYCKHLITLFNHCWGDADDGFLSPDAAPGGASSWVLTIFRQQLNQKHHP